MTTCAICMEEKEVSSMQMLPCSHTFCEECLSLCNSSPLCPSPMCTFIRTVGFAFDDTAEGVDESGQHFDQKPSMLQLEERQHCDAKKDSFPCVNAARMTLRHCRHRVCFDCLSSKVEVAVEAGELPTCAIFRCANRLTKGEIRKLAERVPQARAACRVLLENAPDDAPEEEPPPDHFIIYCSLYQSDAPVSPILYPTACNIFDLVGTMIQVLRLKKNRTAYNVGVYVKCTVGGEEKFDPINVKALCKKKLCETGIRDRTHFIIDVDNELRATFHRS